MNAPCVNYGKVREALERFGILDRKPTPRFDAEKVCAAVRRFAGFTPEPKPNDGLPIDHYRRGRIRVGCVEDRPLGVNNPPRRAD